MTPDRWRQLARIYHGALARSESERADFLRDECGGDSALRRDVESLLAQPASAAEHLSRIEPSGPIGPGTALGPYTIVELVGTGGMGQVYRARDTRVNRDVAIKVLPARLAHDRDRQQRFAREARVTASLSHPHICTLYEFERSTTASGEPIDFLVMEFVEGPTLEEVIAGAAPAGGKRRPGAGRSRRGMPLHTAVEIGAQLADAVEFAHERGVVHRDLKPANIKISDGHQVKVLDFGLARFQDIATDVASSGADHAGRHMASSVSTVTGDVTEMGLVVGTAAYMSPEQARGERVDRHADIWAFGAVLFEALSGRPAFGAATGADTLAAVITQEPDWALLPADVPTSVGDLLQRCLRKDPRDRLQHMGDARIVLREAMAEQPPPSRPRTEHVRLVTPLSVGLFATLAIAMIGLVLWGRTPGTTAGSGVVRTSVSLGGTVVLAPDRAPSLAVSPDGRTIAYAGRTLHASVETQQLYLRRLDALQGTVVPGTLGATAPIFSPDGQWVGLVVSPGHLVTVPVSGGPPRTIARDVGLNIRGMSWGDDGRIVLTINNTGGLSEVSADGGTVQPLTSLDLSAHQKAHRLADTLPGGDAILFTLGTTDIESWDEGSTAVYSRRTGQYKVLVEGGTSARYSTTGHLVYLRGGKLFAAPFDKDALELRGTPVEIVDQVVSSPAYAHAEFAVSRHGTLVYARGESYGVKRRVVWIDADGTVTPVVTGLRAYTNALLSPDERLIALAAQHANDSIWIHDIGRDVTRRLVTGFDNNSPAWTVDGRRLTFSSNRQTPWSIFWQPVDGSAPAELLVRSQHNSYPSSWSPDGQALTFTSNDQTWLASTDGTLVDAKKMLLDGYQSKFSPDGHSLAYTSEDGGQENVHVRRLSDGSTWRASPEGGYWPRFSRDGRSLFFASGDKLMAVDIDRTTGRPVGKARLVLEKPADRFIFADVASDGRFLFIEDTSSAPFASELILVQNFGAELDRLSPSPR